MRTGLREWRVRLFGALAITLAMVIPMIEAAAASAKGAARPIIVIDTDIGDDIDDAYAISWALHSPALDVRAIVTAFGDTQLRARQVRRMLGMLGRADIAVGAGPETPPATLFTQKDWAEAEPATPPARDGIALTLDLIRAHPGQVTLIALAPLTNIRTMIARDPKTFAKLKSVLLMGGSIRRGYDKDGVPSMTPDAEYNAAQSPDGLRALLASGVPVTLFPLDSTQVKLDAGTAERLAAGTTPTDRLLTDLTAQWRATNPWKQTVPMLFDALPVAALLDPTLCPAEPIAIRVDDKGFTHVDPAGAKARACLASDGAAINARLAADLFAAPPPGVPAVSAAGAPARP